MSDLEDDEFGVSLNGSALSEILEKERRCRKFGRREIWETSDLIPKVVEDSPCWKVLILLST
jgi:hypothetical protein